MRSSRVAVQTTLISCCFMSFQLLQLVVSFTGSRARLRLFSRPWVAEKLGQTNARVFSYKRRVPPSITVTFNTASEEFSGTEKQTTSYDEELPNQDIERRHVQHSYDVEDDDEDDDKESIELFVVSSTTTKTDEMKSVNGGTNVTEEVNIAILSRQTQTDESPPHRYHALLKELHLDDGRLKHVEYLPKLRSIRTFDVFCNRELKMSGIRAIGFDMDYTLAQYQQPAFDQLAFNGAKVKLVSDFGYPKEVLDFEYDCTRWTRGLIIDTLRGNFLKIDRHKYVRVAFHGLERMSSMSRKLIYSRTFNKVMSFSEKHFVNMDTLFQFVDAHLFALLIELKDKGEHDALDLKTYDELYKDLRACVDLCHRDGVIKDEVARQPEKYIVLDKGLIPMLQKFRNDGVKLFLLTNSLWEYTSTAMNYLYHGKRVDDDQQKKNEWLDLFDIVIVGSCKPAYMLDPYLNLFRVDPQTGFLQNTDGTYEINAFGENGAMQFCAKGKTFQGGNWLHLHAMLETAAGEEILYVGDHLYSDVLRSKRTLGWRSAFVVPELEEEMRVFNANLPLSRQISKLRKLREELDLYADNIRWNNQLDEKEAEETLRSIHAEDKILKVKLTQLAEQWHHAFHPIWGAMFNAGYQDSRFAFYVQNYACLYTSRATNLGLASSDRSFRTGFEMLPHDKLVEDTNSEFVDYDPWEAIK